MRRVYQRSFDLENVYRGGELSAEESLQDTLDASLSLSLHRLKGVKDSTEALLLEEGAKKLTSHHVNHRFNLDMAKTMEAKLMISSETNKDTFFIEFSLLQ